MDEAFVGRVGELRALADAWAESTAGKPSVVLVHGEAGVGKTALVREFLRSIADRPHQALWTSGDDDESLLAFGLLDQVCRGAVEAESADAVRLGGQLIELLAGEASGDPTVFVIDDAHWGDAASLQVVTFALRRLQTERVLAVLTARDEGLATLPDALIRLVGDRGRQLRLRGLAPAEFKTLISALSSADFSSHAATSLHRHTDGNPLHARALLHEIGPERLLASGDAPLPAPRSFATLVTDRIGACSPGCAGLVRSASVLGGRCRLGDVAQLADISTTDARAAWDEAIAAGLLTSSPAAELTFPHPLVRAAVYHDIPAGLRGALHERAGALDLPEADVLRHRVAAAVGPDDALALALREFAARQAARGTWSTAADAALTAARLETDDGRRWNDLLDGLESLVLGGEAARAIMVSHQLDHCPPIARRDHVLGLLAVTTGDRDTGRRLFERVWASCDLPADNLVAGKAAAQLGMLALNEGRGPDALLWSKRALDLGLDGADAGMAQTELALAHGALDQIPEALDALGELAVTSEDRDRWNGNDLGRLIGRGILRTWSDDLAAGAADLRNANVVAQEIGPLVMRLIALFYLADCEYRLGQWDQATMHAELAASLATDANEVWTLGLTHSVAVFPAAGRGDWALAEEHLAAATAVVDLLGDAANRLWLETARMRLCQARRDHDGLIAAGETILALDFPYGRQEPAIQPWSLLYAEGLIAAGRPDAAEFLDLVEADARRTSHRSSIVGVLRLRGNLAARMGSATESGEHFEQAEELAAGEQVDALGRALLELDHGSALRRAGQRKLAVQHLGRARQMLGDLGARAFLERCDRELASTGMQPMPRDRVLREHLTPQELAVATLVASGLTNREVARELVLSVKTIEFHLSRIFAKLGVKSRSAVAALMSREPNAAAVSLSDDGSGIS